MCIYMPLYASMCIHMQYYMHLYAFICIMPQKGVL